MTSPGDTETDTEPGPRPARLLSGSTALNGILLLLALFALSYASAILIPMTIAILLAIVLSPVVHGLRRVGLPSPAGAGVVIAGLLLVLGGAFHLLAQPAERWLTRLPLEMERLEYELREVKKPIDDLREATNKVGEMAELDDGGTATVQLEARTLTELLVTTTPGLIGAIAMIIVLAAYVLATGDEFLRRLVRSLATFSDKRRAVEVAREVQYQLSRYLFTLTLVNLALGVLTSGVLWALGVPNPLLWGVMAAVLNYAPYIGPLVSTVVLTVVGLLTFDSLLHVFSVPGAYLVLTIIEGQFVTPVVLGRHLALSPLAVILSLIFWGWLWGIAGILMAVPLLACIKALCERTGSLHGVALFLGRRHEPAGTGG